MIKEQVQQCRPHLITDQTRKFQNKIAATYVQHKQRLTRNKETKNVNPINQNQICKHENTMQPSETDEQCLTSIPSVSINHPRQTLSSKFCKEQMAQTLGGELSLFGW